ncbi:DNA polymerase [Eubacterium pyruvativorans]|uniref:DNA polymerase n=1 Tax=Eubacterium pyruvativorans TaxID=155865 RepID=UPI000B7E6E41|nr:DNA polymerase [Eubacterium pyruvativorans]
MHLLAHRFHPKAASSSNYLRREYPEKFRSYSIPEDYVRDYLNPEGWLCSMVWSAYLGLPQSLKNVGAVLGLEEQKLTEGKDLIRYFCMPCKTTKANGGRTRNHPTDAPEKWERFKFYNKRDVEVEMQIQKSLSRYPVPESVWEEYHLDQEINDRGIRIDRKLVESAIELDARTKEELIGRLRDLTGLDNPNSVSRLKAWLSDHGVETDTLGKRTVAALLNDAKGDIREVLSLRQQLAKSSVKKYQAMQNAACEDDRARGMFQFYGANRSGRFSGRLIQLQNLPQNHMPDLAEARALVRDSKYQDLQLLYDDIPNTLSQLIRTAFIPRRGCKFIAADFSSIEARVLAWLAGEQHTIDAFKNGEDIYCSTASAMFGVQVEKHGINGELRQKGKIAVLACGYGGSVGALKNMGALDMGLQEEELKPIVDMWRQANPHIVELWWDVDRAVKAAIKQRTATETHGIKFSYQSQMLFVLLPSGRSLAYVKPAIGENRFGGESITYMGIGTTKKWERIESYGPKIVENIVQAIARDILCYAMRTLPHSFICAHVHDELIIEAGQEVSVQAICDQMSRTPPWAPGLLLRADVYECEFYKKD